MITARKPDRAQPQPATPERQPVSHTLHQQAVDPRLRPCHFYRSKIAFAACWTSLAVRRYSIRPELPIYVEYPANAISAPPVTNLFGNMHRFGAIAGNPGGSVFMPYACRIG